MVFWKRKKEKPIESEKELFGKEKPGMDFSSLETSAFKPPESFGLAKERDNELILSKLETIIAILKSLDQRITNLERIAREEEPKETKRFY